MVTNLAKQVEYFQGTKQQIDKFMKADLDGMIKTYTNDYLMDNIVGIITPQVTCLVEPIKDNLEHRIRSVVRKMLSTTPFTLQPAKASTTPPTVTEPSLYDLLANLAKPQHFINTCSTKVFRYYTLYFQQHFKSNHSFDKSFTKDTQSKINQLNFIWMIGRK